MKQRLAVIAIFAVFVLSCAAFTQNAGPRAGQKMDMGRIAKQLNLSNDQVKSITEVVKKYHADVGDVAKSGVTKNEKQPKLKVLRQGARQSIMGVLNAEQQVKAKKMKLVDRLLSRRPGDPLRGILAKLNLTDQQKASIQSIVNEGAGRVKSVRQDTTLKPEAKRAKCKEIREDTVSKIKEQLTIDQLQKFNEMMQKTQARKRK